MGIHSENSPLITNNNNNNLPKEYNINISSPQASSPEIKLYRRRWLALSLFCLLTMFQSNLWLTYSAVADTAMDVYNIGKPTINLLAAFGAIAFIPFSFHSSWAIDALGLRKSIILAAVVVTFGVVIRSLALKDSLFFLAYIGQFANAAAGPILMTTSPVLSATWFGPTERTLATGLCTTANNMGVPVGFFLGTFVHDKSSLFNMLWLNAVFGVVVFVLILILFEDKPPTPPSLSNQLLHENKKQIKITDFLRDTWTVLCDPSCFNVIVTTTVSAGANSGWSSMLIMILTPLNFSQNQAQWIGVISGAVGLIGGVISGKWHDRFRNYKWTLFFLFFVSTLGYLFLTIATSSYVVSHFTAPYWSILFVIILGNFCLNALYPLSYEALAELAFPVSETVGAGTLSLMINLGCLAYLIFGVYVPISWNSWILVGCCAFSAFVTIFLREQYKRLSVDRKEICNIQN